MHLIFVVIAGSMILVVPSIVASDSTGVGCIRGRIINKKTEEPVPYAILQIVGTTKGAQSDSTGAFCICGLKEGHYTVVGFNWGFNADTIGGVSVISACTTDAELRLEETVIEFDGCAIEITMRDILQITETQSLYHLTSERIKVMPVNDVYDLLRKRGGVTVR